MLLQQRFLFKPTVNFERLVRDYLPPMLPFREGELSWLFSRLASFAGFDREDQGILVLGCAGSGKTAISKMALRVLAANTDGYRNICVANVSWPFPLTLHGLVSEILAYVDPFKTTAGISDRGLIEFLGGSLVENDFRLIVLMEVLKLSPRIISLLEEFVENNRGIRSKPICLVVCARQAAEAQKNGVLKEVLELRPYTREELWKALNYRLSLSSCEGMVEDGALEYVVQKAGLSGDLGYAIHIVGMALKSALTKNEPKVKLEDVLEADKNYVDPSLLATIESLSLHEKLLLYSACTTLTHNGHQEVSIGEVESDYAHLCQRLGLKPRRHTQVWFYIQKLCDLGVISSFVGDKEGRGRTTKILLQHPPTPLEKELRKQIKKHGKNV